MSYHYTEDDTIADVAFEATSHNMARLLEECGRAVTNVMVADLKTIRPLMTLPIRAHGTTFEELLYHFLSEVVFIKDAYQFLVADYTIEVYPPDDGEDLWVAVAYVDGERINAERHNLIVDVKAVTKHRFRVWEENGQHKAFVILDI